MATEIPPAARQILLTLGRIGARALARGSVAVASSATKDLGEFLKNVGNVASQTAEHIESLGKDEEHK